MSKYTTSTKARASKKASMCSVCARVLELRIGQVDATYGQVATPDPQSGAITWVNVA